MSMSGRSYRLPYGWQRHLTCIFVLISGFRRDVDEICGLLGYYTASCGNCLPTVYFTTPSESRSHTVEGWVTGESVVCIQRLETWKQCDRTLHDIKNITALFEGSPLVLLMSVTLRWKCVWRRGKWWQGKPE
jgi:hypothetical protein